MKGDGAKEYQLKLIHLIMIDLAFLTCVFFGRNIFQIVANMDLTIDNIKIFKHIIENQNEAVIIVSNENHKIEYVNTKFLVEFKSQIMNIYESQQKQNKSFLNES